MPDITMCRNETCQIKETCYRYKATPDKYWQPYTTFKEVDGKCEYHLKHR